MCIGLPGVTPSPETSFVFPNNKDREALNDYAFESIIRNIGTTNYVGCDPKNIDYISIIMDVTLLGAFQSLNTKKSRALKAFIRNTIEKKLDNMAGYLNVKIGCKALINKNFCTNQQCGNRHHWPGRGAGHGSDQARV